MSRHLCNLLNRLRKHHPKRKNSSMQYTTKTHLIIVYYKFPTWAQEFHGKYLLEFSMYKHGHNPTSICMLKINNRNTRTRCKICLKLTIKIPEQRQWRPRY